MAVVVGQERDWDTGTWDTGNFSKICFYKQMHMFFAMEKVSVVFPKEFMLMVHKELSKSYREGTNEKLKSMALPYKTKIWKKVNRILCWWYRDW